MNFRNRKVRLTSSQMIILGFAAVILLGSLLLMLPVSTQEASGAPFLDAWFTATSAVCVTGLVVRDTTSYWSVFGQAVILVLIQTGGMGVVMIAISVTMASGRKIGLMQRSTMQEALAAPQMGGIVRLTGFILKMMVLLELLGAGILALVFVRSFGIAKGIWYGLFHSVSAFCNAGFDLMGITEPYSSLTAFSGQPVVNLTVMFLIVVGGIGFLTWEDAAAHRFHLHKYRLQSKVILSVSGILIGLPALYFFLGEFSGLPLGERILTSLFQAVTPRTAGFNTADLTSMSETGLTLMIVLMLIGGSPGSTAGGMKTTTLGVLMASAVAVFRRKEHAQLFERQIPESAIRNAGALLLLYLTLFLTGGMCISRMEDLPMLTCLFETASAIGTVGLTLGITSQLGKASRLILIALMFFGRVGGLTLVFAAVSEKKKREGRLPEEKITVG